MRVEPFLKIFALLAFAAFTLIAFLDPGAFASVRERASEGGIWFVLSLAAAGCGASFTLGVPALGEHAQISLPLLLALVAPYALRRLTIDTWPQRPNRPAKPALDLTPLRPYPEGAPAALPARMTVALIAAARARR